MKPTQNAKCKMKNHFAFGIFDFPPASGIFIFHFSFLIGWARRNG